MPLDNINSLHMTSSSVNVVEGRSRRTDSLHHKQIYRKASSAIVTEGKSPLAEHTQSDSDTGLTNPDVQAHCHITMTHGIN
eukprot:scaffold163288_cov25-Tisochrysis_lutea.AAC.2